MFGAALPDRKRLARVGAGARAHMTVNFINFVRRVALKMNGIDQFRRLDRTPVRLAGGGSADQ